MVRTQKAIATGRLFTTNMAVAQLTRASQDYDLEMRYLLLLCCADLAWTQGTDPKPKAEDYETNGRAQSIAIGAEYMVHSFTGEGKTFFAPDFLVVEVAL